MQNTRIQARHDMPMIADQSINKTENALTDSLVLIPNFHGITGIEERI
jgi:hypothetical protein